MTVIDWSVPPDAKPDWLMGAGATRGERTLVWLGTLAGVAVVGWQGLSGATGEWAWWQHLLAAVVAADLAGGAVSNAASSTKRQYFGPAADSSGLLTRVLRSPVGFAALHVYPFLVVALFPGGGWGWAVGVYVAMLASVAVVDRLVPGYLQRPTAMLLFVVIVFVAPATASSPAGWDWFVVVYTAKLLLAHAVREEPYRPAPGT